jgi:hypothetical protein
MLELCERKKKGEDARIAAITQCVVVPVFYERGEGARAGGNPHFSCEIAGRY